MTERSSLWGCVSMVLPFTATFGALGIGVVLGGAAVWIARPTPVEVLRNVSLAELQTACEPVVADQKTQLAKVKDELTALREEVARKEAEVQSLRGAAERQGSRPASADGRDYSAELQAAKEALAEAKLKIQMLEQVRDELVEQLTRTQERLQVVETDLQEQVAISGMLRDENGRLHDELVVQQWYGFVTNTQLDICERGGRKKTEDCRLSVVGEISTIKREFVHCVRSGQATPSAHELQKGEKLPLYARMMNQDDKHLQSWYVQLCDPTLPEREDER